MKQYMIYNTCGTSVLTNPARVDKSLWDNLIKYSNAKSENDISNDIYATIEKYWYDLIDKWESYSIDEAKHKSAELNSLLTWQELNHIESQKCYCYLLHTDTCLGALAAQLVESWLNKHQYMGCECVRIDNLNTANMDSFQRGLSCLVKWIFGQPSIDSQQQKCIFNVAGGFKAVSGFTQILGQFVADETIYMFEDGHNILSIPKLPMKWDEIESIQRYFDDYHKIALGIPLPNYDHLNTLWIKDRNFTPWGQIAWEKAKEQLYEEKVYPIVCDKIKEGDKFRKSLQNLDKTRIKLLNERLDDLSLYALSGKQNCLGRLDYKPIKGSSAYAFECDAWADKDAKRLFCNEKNGKIIVECLGSALH